jgi:hypothetical protein
MASGLGFDDFSRLSHSIKKSDKPRSLILLGSRRQACSYSNLTTLFKGSYRGTAAGQVKENKDGILKAALATRAIAANGWF